MEDRIKSLEALYHSKVASMEKEIGRAHV
jgi:hypothetical protein